MARYLVIFMWALFVAQVACSDDQKQTDLGPGPDGPAMEAGIDRGVDGAPADAAFEALPTDAAFEAPPPDSAPDAEPTDALPEASAPDLLPPDSAPPDSGVPDVATDITPIDMSPPTESFPTDLPTPTDGGSTPSTINTGEKATGVSSQINRSLVRNATGDLFYCYRAGTTPYDLNIARSINSGATWSVWASKINTETATYDLAGCSLAIDKSGNLYAVWHRYSYSPTYHATYFRKYDPNQGSWSTQATINQSNIKSSTSAVAVDSQGYLYVLAGATTSWHYHLWKSTSPGASGLTFTDLGDPSSYSYSQTGALVIDYNDNAHVLFYGVTSSTGVIFHRYYSGGWKTATPISTVAAPNDKPGPMAADGQGNVHILYVDGGGSNTDTHSFQYRKWSASGTMGSPILLYSHTATLHSNATIANPYTINIAANETTGDVYVVGRNLNAGGALCLYKKTPTASSFTLVKKLRPDNMTSHYYYMPRIRGTVTPSFNRTETLLDVSWIEDASASSASKFMRLTAP